MHLFFVIYPAYIGRVKGRLSSIASGIDQCVAKVSFLIFRLGIS